MTDLFAQVSPQPIRNEIKKERIFSEDNRSIHPVICGVLQLQMVGFKQWIK